MMPLVRRSVHCLDKSPLPGEVARTRRLRGGWIAPWGGAACATIYMADLWITSNWKTAYLRPK